MIMDTALSPAEAYRTFNMGLGLALALPAGEVRRAIEIAAGHGIEAWEIGRVEDQTVSPGKPDGEALGNDSDPAMSIFGIPSEWVR